MDGHRLEPQSQIAHSSMHPFWCLREQHSPLTGLRNGGLLEKGSFQSVQLDLAFLVFFCDFLAFLFRKAHPFLGAFSIVSQGFGG